MPETNKTITISIQEYNELRHNAAKLQALYAAGVDNWEGYDYALDLLSGDEEK